MPKEVFFKIIPVPFSPGVAWLFLLLFFAPGIAAGVSPPGSISEAEEHKQDPDLEMPGIYLNPDIRRLFHDYYKEMISTHPAGKKSAGEFLDRLIEDHIQQITKAQEQLYTDCLALENALKGDDSPIYDRQNKECRKRLQSIDRQLKRLDGLLFFIYRGLLTSHRYQEEDPDLPLASVMEKLVRTLHQLNEAIDQFFFTDPQTVSLEGLQKESLFYRIDQARKLRDLSLKKLLQSATH